MLPYLVQNAQLLVQRHKTVKENHYEVTGLNSAYVKLHESID